MKRAMLTAALLGATMLAACGGDLTDAEYLARAQNELNEGDFSAALIEARNAVRVNPSSAEARYLLGSLSMVGADYDTATKEFERAIELGYENEDDAVLSLVRAYLRSGDNEAALEVAEDASLSTDDARAQMSVLRGGALLRLGRAAEAEPLLRAGVQRGVGVDAYSELARLLLVRGQTQEAEDVIETALLDFPDDVPLLVLKGEAELRLQKPEEADESFTRAYELNPRIVETRIGQARAKLALGEFDSLEDLLADIERTAPNRPDVQLFRAIVLFEEQNWNESFNLAEQVLSLVEDESTALYIAGTSSYFLNNFETANRRLTRYLAVNPSNAAARRLLSAAKLQLGDTEGARRVIEASELTAGEDLDLATLASVAALLAGENESAVAYLEEAARFNPEDTLIRARLAMTRLAAGDAPRGLEELAALIEEDDRFRPLTFQLALGMMREGRYSEAIDAARDVQEQFPENSIGYMLEGAALALRGEFEPSTELFKRAYDLDPDSIAAAGNYARILEASGDIDGSRAVLEGLIANNPNSVLALTRLSGIEQRQQNFPQAIEYLEQVTQIEPANLEARSTLGQLYFAGGQPAEAAEELRQILNVQPENLAALEIVGRAEEVQQNWDPAIEAYRRIQRVTPETEEPYIWIARIYQAQGQRLRAVEELEGALNVNPDFRAARIALAQVTIGVDNRRAQRELDRLEREIGETAQIARLKGDLTSAEGDSDGAIAHYVRALELEPTGPRAVQLSRAFRGARQPDRAVSTLETFLEANPEDLTVLAELGEFHITSENYEGAQQAFEGFLAVAEGDPIALNNLAWVKLQLGDLDGAHEDIEAALERQPDNLFMVDTYGEILLEAGDHRRAREMFERAREGLPGSPTVAFHLAKLYYAEGNRNRARELVQEALNSSEQFVEREDAEGLLRQLGG